MDVVNNICFLCLKHSGKNNLKILLHKETEDDVFTHVRYALPELTILDSQIPVYICSTCYTTLLSFSTFKKKCLENYIHLIDYIKMLQETNNTKHQGYSEIQNEQEMKIELNIKEEIKYPLLSSTVAVQQINNELELKYNDNKQLKTEENELDNIKNEPVKEELFEEQEEVFTIQLNTEIKSEEQNDEKPVVEDYIEIKNETLDSKNSEDQKIYQELLKRESENDVQNGGSSEGNKPDETSSVQNVSPSQGIQCVLCGEICLDKSILDSHLANHINNVTSLDCPICFKTFVTKRGIKNHLKGHLGIKKYECVICHKRFVEKTNLSTHLKFHSVVKEFKCNMCNCQFVRLSRLNEHLKHKACVKEFQCALCNKRFFKPSHLKSHQNRKTLCISAEESDSS